METDSYTNVLWQALKGSPLGIVVTFLIVVVAKWVYFLSLNSMGDSVTTQELGNVLLVRLGSDLLVMLAGFSLLFSVTKRLISPMHLGFFRFSLDTTIAAFGALLLSMIACFVLSLLLSLTVTSNVDAMVEDLGNKPVTQWAIVGAGFLVICLFICSWIAMLAQCIVNRYQQKKDRQGLWRLRYLRQASLMKPLIIASVLIATPPMVGSFFEHADGGAGISTLLQGLATLVFAFASASGVAVIVGQERAEADKHVQ